MLDAYTIVNYSASERNEDMANNPNYSAMRSADTQYTHPAGILVSDYYSETYGYTCYRPEGTKDWLIMYTFGHTSCRG